MERNYNLDFKNPNGAGAKEQKDPKELVKEIAVRENRIITLLQEIKQQL